MAGGRTIDKIGVKVIPDLSGFRADVVKKLRAMPGIEIGIDAYLEDVTDVKRQLDVLSRDRTVKIAVDADRTGLARFSDGIEREMRESRETVDNSLREIERALEDVMRRKDINFPVGAEIDNEAWTRFRRDISRLVERYGEEHLITPGVELDDSHKHVLEEELDRLIREYDGKEISLDVNADSFWASRQLSWVSRSRFVDLYVRVNEHSLAAATTAIAALSGGRLLSDVGQDVWDFFKDLDRSIPSITMWTTGIINLTGAMVGFLTQIASFSADLGRISPMLLTLPGLFMGGAVALLATVNAWMDVKDQLGELEEPITNLRELMSGSYWDEAREPILDMVTNLMPQLEVVMSNASAAMGGFTGAFASALETSLGGGNLEQIFESMAEGFRIMEAGAQGYADMIVHLALIAGEYWPRLADWMTRQATSFAGWMDAIATDGRLDFWMERAIDNLYELGYGLADMGRLLAGVTEAAERAGATGLAGFHDVMERWQLVINSDNGQRALTDYFEGGRRAAEGLGDAIEAIFVGLSNVSDGVRDTFGQSGSTIAEIGRLFGDVLGNGSVWVGLESMLARMESGVAKVRGASEEVAEFIGAGAEVVGHFADELAGPLSAALEVILPKLTGLQGPFETLITALTTGLESIIRSNNFDRLVTNIADLVGILVALAVDAVPVLVPVLDVLLGVLAAIPPELVAIGIVAGGAWAGLSAGHNFALDLIGSLTNLGVELIRSKGRVADLAASFVNAGNKATALGGLLKTGALVVGIGATIALFTTMRNKVLDATASVEAFSHAFSTNPAEAVDLRPITDSFNEMDLDMFKDHLDGFWMWVSDVSAGFDGASASVQKTIDSIGTAMVELSRTEGIDVARDALNEYAAAGEFTDAQLKNMIYRADDWRAMLDAEARQLGINIDALSEAEASQVRLAIATGDASVASGEAAEALRGVDFAAQDADVAVNRLFDTLAGSASPFYDAKYAAADYEQALAYLSEVAIPVTSDGLIDLSDTAGVQAVRAFQDLRDSALNWAEMLWESDPEGAIALLQSAADAIQLMGENAGLSQSEIDGLLGGLDTLPSELETLITVKTPTGEDLAHIEGAVLSNVGDIEVPITLVPNPLAPDGPPGPDGTISGVPAYVTAGESYGQEFGLSFQDGASPYLSIEALLAAANEGGSGGGSGGGSYSSQGSEIGATLAESIADGISGVAMFAPLEAFLALLPLLSDEGSLLGRVAGNSIGQSVADGLNVNVPVVDDTARTLVRRVDDSMATLPDHGFKRAVDMGDGLERGLAQAQAASVAAVARMVSVMLGAMAVMNTAGFSVGASLGQGIARGIQSTIASVAAAAAALVATATAAAKKAGDIHSPSRLWEREIGYQLGAGGARGIARSAALMANAARDAMPVPVLETAGAGGGAGVGAPTIGQVTLVSKNDDPGEDIREVWHYTKVIAGGGDV